MAWTAPRTWVAGETVTAAQMNTHIRDNLLDAFPNTPDAWTIYSPVLTATTNPTLGNSTLTGSYMVIGNTVHFRFRLTIGSTFSAGSGTYQFTLPLPTSANVTVNDTAGTGAVNDTLRRPVIATVLDTTHVILVRCATEAVITNAGVGAAFATGNTITVSGTYEHA